MKLDSRFSLNGASNTGIKLEIGSTDKVVRLAAVTLISFIVGCAGTQDSLNDGHYPLTISQIGELRDLAPLLPILPDSVVTRYERYSRSSFYEAFDTQIVAVGCLVDSLNDLLTNASKIETLAIDHSFENLGVAGTDRRFSFRAAISSCSRTSPFFALW